MAGSPAESLLFHRRAVRQRDDAANTLYAGLFVETEPIYGRPCRHRPCGLQYAPAQREQANGFDGPASPEADMAGISGYLGTLYLISHIKRSLSALAGGFFFFDGAAPPLSRLTPTAPLKGSLFSPCLPLRGGAANGGGEVATQFCWDGSRNGVRSIFFSIRTKSP